MSTLICGSIAYDTIMVFRDRFKHHILPDQLHILNVAFLVPRYAARIRRLRRQHRVQAEDAGRRSADHGDGRRDDLQPIASASTRSIYRSGMCASVAGHLHGAGVHHHRSRRQPDHRVSSGRDEPFAREPRRTMRDGSELGIVAPDGRTGMLQHAREFVKRGIPFIFDPGQGLPMFNGEELLEFVRLADYVTVNDYEAQLLQERTGRSRGTVAKLVKALVVTLGARRSMVHTGGTSDRDPLRQGQPRWWIRPAAAMPFAPVCCTDSRMASTGRRRAGSHRCWDRSRSRSAAGRTTASRATKSRSVTVMRLVLVSGER